MKRATKKYLLTKYTTISLTTSQGEAFVRIFVLFFSYLFALPVSLLSQYTIAEDFITRHMPTQGHRAVFGEDRCGNDQLHGGETIGARWPRWRRHPPQ